MKQFSISKSQFLFEEGFTLIELLVVISLMAILMASSVSVFFSYTKSQTFTTSVSDVVTLLNKAKSRSLSQIKPSQCNMQKLQGYQVVFTLSKSDYRLEALCDNNRYVIERKMLPANIIFGELSSSIILFNASTGVVNLPSSVIVIGPDKTKTINIDGVGNISVQ